MKYTQPLYLYTKLTQFYVAVAFCSILIAFIYSSSLFSSQPEFSLSGINVNLPSSVPARARLAPVTPGLVNLQIGNGDTLLSVLQDANVAKADALNAIKALTPYHDLAGLSIGQKIKLTFDTQDTASPDEAHLLRSLAIKTAPEKELRLVRTADGTFSVTEVVAPLTRKIMKISGTIDSSLLATSAALGVPTGIMMDLIKAYSYDIDFQRDIQSGDKFEVLLERFYTPEGELARDGEALYSSLTLDNKKLAIYHHTTAEGDEGFFTADGRSVRKDLLRTPLNIVHISSHFGMRKHPVLGYSKMHKGVDFSASTGTPILAAGAGIVEEIGHKGTYGNYVRIRHTAEYSTAYAHASRFAKLKKGDTVKQGEVIAYVGSTGRSTGPHLHYEVLVNNQQADPLGLKVSPGIKLLGNEWDRFTQHKQNVNTLMAKIPAQGEIALESVSSKMQVN